MIIEFEFSKDIKDVRRVTIKCDNGTVYVIQETEGGISIKPERKCDERKGAS